MSLCFHWPLARKKAWYKLEESAGGLLDEDLDETLLNSPVAVAIGRVCLNRFIIIRIIVIHTYIDVSENSDTPKSSILIGFSWVFHYKPSILGYPYFWKHPHNLCCLGYIREIDRSDRSRSPSSRASTLLGLRWNAPRSSSRLVDLWRVGKWLLIWIARLAMFDLMMKSCWVKSFDWKLNTQSFCIKWPEEF